MDILPSNGAVTAQVPLSHLALGRIGPSNQQNGRSLNAIAPNRDRLSIFHIALLAEILTAAHGHFVEQADLLARQELQFTPQGI
jgi:hypothetical protein